MNYEDNIKELEKIVKALSDGKLGVQKGLELYKRGIEIASECLNSLNEVKGQMEILNKNLQALEVEVEDDE